MAKKKWFPTPEIDALIRSRYDHVRREEIARQLGWPKWAVGKRARELGVARIKERPWSKEEIDYLEANYGRVSMKTMSRRLGRTIVAIRLKAKRKGYRKGANGEGYTAYSLAQALGVDSHWVTARIRSGRLKASHRKTERTERQGGDMYYISDRAVVDFITEHPFEIDLRKVDQLWFLELVADHLNHRL